MLYCVGVAASHTNLAEVDALDAGWEDEEDAVDSGWDEVAAGLAPDEPEEPEPAGLTREERVARAAARKERLHAKAAEKAQRRKARASAAASKQKKSKKIAAKPHAARPVERTRPAKAPHRDPEGEAALRPAAADRQVGRPSLRAAWFDKRTVGLALALLAVAGAVAAFLFRR